MTNQFDQLRDSRHFVAVDASAEINEWLNTFIGVRSDSITWTNQGTMALRLVPSHHDAIWLVGEQLADMNGSELLELLFEIEPALEARLVTDWSSIEVPLARQPIPAANQKDWLDGY